MPVSFFSNTCDGHDVLIPFYFVYVPAAEKKNLELVLNLFWKVIFNSKPQHSQGSFGC